ncbi:MAG: sialidase family protein, partial [Endomicrobiia bacterium]
MKINFLLFILFIFLQLFTYSQQSDIRASATQWSLVSNDHVFKGFIQKLKNGSLIHVFRLDSGITGNHVGNNGAVAQRFSYDDGKTWSKPQIIYSDKYDDRASAGGVLDDGTIVVFFFRYYTYDVWNGVLVDNRFILSKDNGKTWTEPQLINSDNGCMVSMNIFKIDGIEGYFAPGYGSYCADLRYSKDGSNWDSVYYYWKFNKDTGFNPAEPTFTCVGNGRVIGIFRVENKALHQVIS